MLEKQGLVKLVEECGELIQIASKKMTRMDSDEHWDGKGSLRTRMEDEIADVQAILEVIQHKFDLDLVRIQTRKLEKMICFIGWDKQPEDSAVNV